MPHLDKSNLSPPMHLHALIVQEYLFPFWNERKNLKDSHLWNYAERADCNINLCAKLI